MCFRWPGWRSWSRGHYNVDFNLLIAGVVLHDIGKIYELSYDRAFGYSPEGQLLGHIAIAIRMIADKTAGLSGVSGGAAKPDGAYGSEPPRAA